MQFHQELQQVFGSQQNAGRDIINNVPKETYTPPIMLPPRAQSFVGREEDLLWLLQKFTSETGMTLAICGPGGMGKTALAAEALSQLITQPDCLIRFPGGIFYHSFYIYPSLVVFFEDLALLGGETYGSDPRRAAMRILSRHRMLLVFDGVEVLTDAFPLQELGGQHIVLLLSRRQSDASDREHRCDLDVLSHEQAIVLLQKLAGSRAADRRSIERLVQYIDGYPLALQLAGNYLASHQEEVSEYVQWFEQEGLGALHHGIHQTQSVSVLLQRTYSSLTLDEQHLFVLLGLLAPAPFPFELVQNILALPEQSTRQALSSLVNLNVLRRPNLDYEVSHPLVHTFLTELLSSDADNFSGNIPIWQERFLDTLTIHFDQNDSYDKIDFALWHPHVIHLLSTNYITNEQLLRTAHIFNSVGVDSYIQGKYTDAKQLHQRALTILEHVLGNNHPATARSLSNLAAPYYAQGEYREAELLLQRALAIREQCLGTNQLDTANSLNNLAALYRVMGRYDEAEPLFQQALKILEQQSKDSDPILADCLSSLAILYQARGKYAEAEPLYQRSLMILEHHFDPTHPDIATSLNNLAYFYEAQGRYVEAEPLYQRALMIYEQVLGDNHPNTAQGFNNLAGLYETLGKYSEAESLYHRALKIREQVLGGNHSDTAQSLNNLAYLFHTQGKNMEAEPLYRRALEIREQALGANHPDTADSLNNLASLYDTLGKYNKAESLYHRALKIREHALGTNHPATAQIINNLASLYHTQGKYVEEEPLLIKAREIREQVWDVNHPDTATSLNNLAVFYQSQGKYIEAERLYQQALPIWELVLGKTHPNTLSVQKNYAILRQIMKQDTNRIHLSPQHQQHKITRKKNRKRMTKQSRKKNYHK